MNEELIKAKIELYRQLMNASSSAHSVRLTDVESTIFTLLAQDVHIKMKLEGRFPNF